MIKGELQAFERGAYEQYLTALIKAPHDEKALVESLQKFVPGSDTYDFLYLLTKQKLTNGDLCSSDRDKLTYIIQRQSAGFKELDTRQHLLDVDLDKKSVESVIDTLLHFKPQQHHKPRNTEHQGIAKQGEESSATDSEMLKNATIKDDAFDHDIIKSVLEALEIAKKASQNQGNADKVARMWELESGTQIMRLPPHSVHSFDFKLFHPAAVVKYAVMLAHQNTIGAVVNPSFWSQLIAGIIRSQSEHHQQRPSNSLYDKITLAKLKEFLNAMPNSKEIIAVYFNKKYHDSVENFGVWTTNQEKYDNLSQLYESVKSDKIFPLTLRHQLLEELVILGPSVNIYNKLYFTEIFNQRLRLLNPQHQREYDQRHEPTWQSLIPNIFSMANYQVTERQHLEHFCIENQGSLKEFDVVPFTLYFDIKALEDQVRVSLSKTGLEGLKLNKQMTAAQFQAYADVVSLTFLPHNKEKFRIDEPVELFIKVKNVKTLHCKVFEFNTLTYYRKTLKPFDTGVDLDGLESTIERKVDYSSHPSNCPIMEKFEFPELAGKQGLFIIEFAGNGRSARAVVKKGSLSLIHKSTIAGHEATILDDSRQVCKGPDTGIWLDGKFFLSQPDGNIFIPYAIQAKQHTVIMSHGDFAQLGEFMRKQESYDLKCQFFLNEESVLVGSTVTILMTPMLQINGRKAELSLLQNIVAKVKTEDFIDGIPTTQTFSNLKTTQGQDLTLSLQVPPNLKYIQVTLTCQVLNTTTKQMVDFAQAKTFDIQTFEASNQVHEFHLRMVKDNKYEILCLGKNGEPKPLMPVNIACKHAEINEMRSMQLTTDNLGKVYLGRLDKVQEVTTGSRSWMLPNLYNDEWCYPSVIDSVVGGSVQVPVAQMWKADSDELMREQVTLIRSIGGQVVEDWFTRIKLIKKANSSSHYYNLVISDLEAGNYFLQLRGQQNHSIQITVHHGEFLGYMESFIMKKNCLQELVTSQKILKIEESQLVSQYQLQVKLADFGPNARVHIIATHFLPENCHNLLNSVASMLTDQIGSSVFTFAKWSNLLLSDRHLSDEYRYVFDRVNAERTLGNSLDRPSLVNKRIFTRKTDQDQETLSKGNEYAQNKESVQRQQVMPNQMERRMADSSRMFGAPNQQVLRKGYITDYQNFLKDAPLTAFNLKPNQEGLVTFTHERLDQYATLQIVVVDESSVMQSTRCLQQLQMPAMRDLSLKKSLNESKGMTESRQHKNLLKGQSDFTEDITSSQVMLVDDLFKVEQIMTEVGNCQNDKVWKDLEFVKKWPSQTNKQKNFFFTTYQCHEVNFFIKKHDTKYFDEVVRGFLCQKMEKSLVDLYLLDRDAEILIKYGKHVFKVLEMNSFEKCLMLEVFMRNNQQALSKRIVKQMKQKWDSGREDQSEYDIQQHNRIFDLVLNMNSTLKNTGPIHRQQDRMMARMERCVSPQMMMKSCASAEDVEMHTDEECYDDYDMGMQMKFAEAEMCAFGVTESNVYQQQRLQNFTQEKFQELEATCEYMETFYYNTKLKQSHECVGLVSDNRFWLDYADHLVNNTTASFISHNFTDCCTDIEKFFVKVLMDLPQVTNAAVHKSQADSSRGLTITAGSNLIIYKKEIKEVEVEIKQDFMVTHRYQRIDDYGRSNRSDEDDAIPTEFLINTPYECEVIMTNVSPNSTQFNLLYQVPIGSMPIKKTKFMKSQPLTLASYSTERLSFTFYFPQTGIFGHYPSNVSIGEKVTARGQFNQLNVVKFRKINNENALELNFDDLVQVGTNDQILDYLRQKNILSTEKGFSFQKIKHLLCDNAFYEECLKILRERQHFEADVWSFARQHNDAVTLREFLMITRQIGDLNNISCHFKSWLFEKSPQLDYTNFHRMLEYNPMINSRAHAVGEQNTKKILNKTFRQSYDCYLQTMAYKKELLFGEKLIFVYYLQLQDRIPEALSLFAQIEPPSQSQESSDQLASAETHELELQYDYLNAYFDFFTGAEDKYSVARRVVQRYDNYPVSNWRMMFLAIEDQLNDFDGEFDQMQGDYESESGSSLSSESAQRERKQENLKNSKQKEPSLSQTSIDDKGVLTIEAVNMRTIAIKYYMIDAEILFSRAPFLKDNAEEFSYVKPCQQTNLAMYSALEDMSQYVTKQVPLPASLLNKNLVIEINGEGQQQFKTFYSCQLKVQINEAFGELKVMHSERNVAASKVYVKVFQLTTGGKEEFYRDGYTDIRGKFEYAQTSGDKLKSVKKFAILVQSEEFGSQIKEVNPPKDESVSVVGGGQAASSMLQAKQERIMNRNNFVQSKRSHK